MSLAVSVCVCVCHRKYLAANGAVMRTSILGILNFNGNVLNFNTGYSFLCPPPCSPPTPTPDIDQVIENTSQICQVTHADPRCLASCVAVTTAVSHNSIDYETNSCDCVMCCVDCSDASRRV